MAVPSVMFKGKHMTRVTHIFLLDKRARTSQCSSHIQYSLINNKHPKRKDG